MPKRIAYHRPANAPPASSLYRKAASRMEDNRFYCSTRWRVLRRDFLIAHPLCADCERKGRTTLAQHVHHEKPRKLHPELAFDWSNLEALCLACHNAREER